MLCGQSYAFRKTKDTLVYDSFCTRFYLECWFGGVWSSHDRIALSSLGVFGSKTPAFCSYRPNAFEQGKEHTQGALFTTTEQIGVHGFNVILATGGLVAGLLQVAWEGLLLLCLLLLILQKV